VDASLFRLTNVQTSVVATSLTLTGAPSLAKVGPVAVDSQGRVFASTLAWLPSGAGAGSTPRLYHASSPTTTSLDDVSGVGFSPRVLFPFGLSAGPDNELYFGTDGNSVAVGVPTRYR
jgi:hypothetical protein